MSLLEFGHVYHASVARRLNVDDGFYFPGMPIFTRAASGLNSLYSVNHFEIYVRARLSVCICVCGSETLYYNVFDDVVGQTVT